MGTVLGPCPCQDCGTLVFWARSQTRETWNGPVVAGWLTWRERGGRVHKCPKARSVRIRARTDYEIDAKFAAKLRAS
jgi:hypothetical protein